MIYLIIGRRERGKTSLAIWMARRFRSRAILDPRGMITAPDAEYIGFGHEALNAIGELLEPDSPWDEVIYRPTEDDLVFAFDLWSGACKRGALEHPHATWAIVIDEASFFDLGTPAFQWLVKCTARDRVHVFITAHRPQDIPTTIRAIADHWLVFAVRQEHDLKALRERSEGLAREAGKLTDREFAWWNDATGTLLINRRPDSWRLALDAGGQVEAGEGSDDAA